MRGRLIAAIVCVSLVAPGCQTIDTLNDPNLKGSPVYSGTQRNATYMGLGLLNFSTLMFFVGLIDFPLSLVADTLVLPVTIRRASQQAEVRESVERIDADLPSPVTPREGESPVDVARRLFEECRQRTERLDPAVTDCYAVDAVVRIRGADAVQTFSGAEYKLELRDRIPDLKYAGDYVTWRDPEFEADGERVRVIAQRATAFSPARAPFTLVIARGADGGWRIVEESGPGWP